jgi:hypothetical protein
MATLWVTGDEIEASQPPTIYKIEISAGKASARGRVCKKTGLFG